MAFHPTLWVAQKFEAKLLIQFVRVLRNQRPAAQPLQLRVANNTFHQPSGKTFTTMFFHDKNISKVGVCGVVSNYPRKTHLPAAL
jgi:hypothetical protein